MQNIILIGFKNCGKSTYGKLLAARLAMQFLDTDQSLEQRYYEHHHIKLLTREIYQTIGEMAFRKLEKETISSLQNVKNTVIATGGGSVLDSENSAVLKQLGMLIYLRTPKSLIKERAFADSNKLPAFLTPSTSVVSVSNSNATLHHDQTTDSDNAFEKMYAERELIYERLADLVIDVNANVTI